MTYVGKSRVYLLNNLIQCSAQPLKYVYTSKEFSWLSVNSQLYIESNPATILWLPIGEWNHASGN